MRRAIKNIDSKGVSILGSELKMDLGFYKNTKNYALRQIILVVE
jgi:hypothetical protein